MSPVRAVGVLFIVAASAVACVFVGAAPLALALCLLAPVASHPRLAGLAWLSGVAVAVLGVALGLMPLSVGATLAALCVLLAGLGGPSGLAVVGAALVLALIAPQVRGLRFLLPLALCGVGVPLLLVGDRIERLGPALRPWANTLVIGVVVTGVGFMGVPRVGVAPAVGPALTGFQAQVELDDIAELFDDPTPFARLQVTRGELLGPPRLRGVALEHFDGLRWTAPADRRSRAADLSDAHLIVQVQPLGLIDEGALLALGSIAGADIHSLVDGAGNRWAGPAASEPYSVALAEAPDDDVSPGRWLDVPASLDPRIVSLALDWSGDQTAPMALSERLVGHLRDTALYTRRPSSPRSDDPVADFLFGSRAGHCEHWATALTLLLRVRGVQARLVNGFVDLEPDGDGYIARRSHAHAWVEVRVGSVWVVVDPTPGVAALPAPPPPTLGQRVDQTWQGQVLGWDRLRQRQVARALVRGVVARPWLIVLAYLGAFAVGVWWIVSRRNTGVAAAHRKVCRALARHGLRPPASLPPVDAARWAVAILGPEAQAIERVAWLVYAVRYGGESDAEQGPLAHDLARDIQRNLPRLCASVGTR